MNFKNLITALFIYIAFSLNSYAKGPVWKVSNDDHHLFLGGTIHVLSPSDYPLPKQFEQAYALAQTLVFETDINAINEPTAQAQMLQVMMYQDGTNLRTQLSAETSAALDKFLISRGLPSNSFDRLTPAGVSMTLTVTELQRLGLGVTSGVDQFFSSRGERDGKPIEALETIEQQIGFIASMNEVDANKMLQSTLRDLADLDSMWESMVSAWRAGDMQALDKLGTESMEKDFPKIYKLLLDDRNANWMKQLPAMLKDEDVEFVLVGSLHMAGERGLLARLKDAGYQVEQLD